MTHKFSQWWISVSLTLFVVAFVLLMLIIRDQRTAMTALTTATIRSRPSAERHGPFIPGSTGTTGDRGGGQRSAGQRRSPPMPSQPLPPIARTGLRLAAVERGRIASMGGITAVIWLVILVLMVWH